VGVLRDAKYLKGVCYLFGLVSGKELPRELALRPDRDRGFPFRELMVPELMLLDTLIIEKSALHKSVLEFADYFLYRKIYLMPRFNLRAC
jgi:hypothetical protein